MVIFWVRKGGQNCVFVFGSGMVTRECRKKLLTFARCVHSMSVMGYFGCPVPLCCVFGQKKKKPKNLPCFYLEWFGICPADVIVCWGVGCATGSSHVGSVRVAERCVDVGVLPNCPQQLLSQHPCVPGGGEGSGELPAWCRW